MNDCGLGWMYFGWIIDGFEQNHGGREGLLSQIICITSIHDL